MQKAQAWLGKATLYVTMETRPFLFNTELPPEKLKYLILNWTVIIIKWKRQWKGLSTNMKAHIHISYALPQTRNNYSNLFNQLKNTLWDCKYHKLAIMLTDKVRFFFSVHYDDNFSYFAVKHLVRHSIRR